MARQTLVSTNARIDALEAKIDARMDRIEALLSPAAPAKRASAKKASAPVASAPKGKVTNLTRANRPQFVAAAPWAKGLSTKDIAMAVISGAQKAPKGWAIGEGYRALFAA